MKKSLLRKKSRLALSSLSIFSKRNDFFRSKKRWEQLLARFHTKSLTILTYNSLPHEPDLSEIYKRIKEQFKVTFIVATKELKDPGTYIDLAFVPGLLFDESGVRLGQGGGWYDRFFEKHPETYKVGVCYKEQLIEIGKIPVDDWDVSMDRVVVL